MQTLSGRIWRRGAPWEGRAPTPVTGEYFIVLPTGKIYGYFVVAEGYFGTSSSLDLRNQTQFEVVQEDIELVYLEDALDAEKDLTIRINNLFFEYGSDKLTPLSNAELLRVKDLAPGITEKGQIDRPHGQHWGRSLQFGVVQKEGFVREAGFH